jgi:hypothetical protein
MQHEWMQNAYKFLIGKLERKRPLGRHRRIHRGADKSLAFPISYFPICSTTKGIFLGWVNEVRTTKS